MNLQQILNTTLPIVYQAGSQLREGYRATKQIKTKSSAVDVVTQYDTQIERFLVAQLAERFPDHHHFAEEGEYDQVGDDALTWYIDPIDGTTNFTHGYPAFTLSLALYQGSRPLVGIVYDPLRDECFQATSGGGAFLVQGGQPPEPLSVTKTDTLVASLIATGFPYDRHSNPHNNTKQFAAFLTKIQGIRRSGSAALDLVYVAAGRLDGYWEFRLNSWDVAAGILLVTEAGGQITNIDGSDFRLAPQVDLIASNGQIHSHMKAVLSATGFS